MMLAVFLIVCVVSGICGLVLMFRHLSNEAKPQEIEPNNLYNRGNDPV